MSVSLKVIFSIIKKGSIDIISIYLHFYNTEHGQLIQLYGQHLENKSLLDYKKCERCIKVVNHQQAHPCQLNVREA